MENFFPFEKNPKICVAVSGGADSLALTLLTNNWVKKFNGSVIGVTIDHSLRDNSADEAQHVSKELEKFDINHQIIKYDGPKPKTRIQEIARKYRYQLLGDFCKRKNIYHLLVGHHSLDQKETCLMRSWRDSGFIGLAGMSAIIEFNSHRLLRPMLNIDPKELKKYLSDRQVIWVEDISNKNNFYLRVRAREHLVKNSWNLNRTFAKKRIELEKKLSKWFSVNAEISSFGYVKINFKEFLICENHLREQILSRSISTVGGLEYSPSLSSLNLVSKHFANFSTSKSLGGCLILKKLNCLFVVREIRNNEPKKIMSNGGVIIWDRRFIIKMSKTDEKQVKLHRLGRKGFDQLTNAGYYIYNSNIPKLALFSLPALWKRDKVVSVPHLGVKLEGNIEVTANFSPLQSLSPSGFAVVN